MDGAVLTRDLTLRQGKPFTPSFTWKRVDQSAVDLSNVVRARMEVRPKAGDSHLLLAFDTDPAADPDGTITLGGPNGTIALYLAESATWKITRIGVYDLILEQPEDEPPVTFASGRFLLSTPVTRFPALTP